MLLMLSPSHLPCRRSFGLLEHAAEQRERGHCENEDEFAHGEISDSRRTLVSSNGSGQETGVRIVLADQPSHLRGLLFPHPHCALRHVQLDDVAVFHGIVARNTLAVVLALAPHAREPRTWTGSPCAPSGRSRARLPRGSAGMARSSRAPFPGPWSSHEPCRTSRSTFRVNAFEQGWAAPRETTTIGSLSCVVSRRQLHRRVRVFAIRLGRHQQRRQTPRRGVFRGVSEMSPRQGSILNVLRMPMSCAG